jgi:hypothetical protein
MRLCFRRRHVDGEKSSLLLIRRWSPCVSLRIVNVQPGSVVKNAHEGSGALTDARVTPDGSFAVTFVTIIWIRR